MKLKCKRCESEWESKKVEATGELPVQCPRCKRTDWAVPKGFAKLAKHAAANAPEGTDRVDFYSNQSHVGSVAVPQVPIVTAKKPSFGINVDDFLRSKGIGNTKEPEPIEEVEEEARPCMEDTCGKPMRQKFGKWFCIDSGCPMQGKEQK